VKESVAATEDSVGGARRSSVVVDGELEVVPSFTDQVTVRVWSEPELVGFGLGVVKATDCSTAW
jgi:hypothetical protein